MHIEEEPSIPHYEVVYLATYPRSGNHWMRYMIEEVTGIATSSIYCDPDPQHLSFPYPWEGYLCLGGYEGNRRPPKEGDIVVLKTHQPFVKYDSENQAPKVVRIIRHPVDSIYSFYVWVCEHANGEITLPIPNDFFESAVKSWKIFQEYYNSLPSVLTFRFEDLLEAPFENLSNTIHFIGYPATDDDIQRAINRYPPKSSPLKYAEHFTSDQLAEIRAELQPLAETYGYIIPK